jgi:hypothetical protein
MQQRKRTQGDGERMVNYVTIAVHSTAETFSRRWALTPAARIASKKLCMNEEEYLAMHTEMARADDIWLFHRKVGPYLYDIIVAPKWSHLPE